MSLGVGLWTLLVINLVFLIKLVDAKAFLEIIDTHSIAKRKMIFFSPRSKKLNATDLTAKKNLWPSELHAAHCILKISIFIFAMHCPFKLRGVRKRFHYFGQCN